MKKYLLTINAKESEFMWELLENQLNRLADEVQGACGVPFTIERQDKDTGKRMQMIRDGEAISEYCLVPSEGEKS